MGLQDKLQHFAAPADAFVVGIDGALTGDAVVDAHLRALEAGKKLLIVHVGAPTSVAVRMAARLHATLVSADSIMVPHLEALVAHETPLALPAHIEEALALADVAAELPAITLHEVMPESVVPVSDPVAEVVLPEVASAPEAPALLEVGHLPWGTESVAADMASVTVEEDEFEAMPWNVVHHQLLPSGRESRIHTARPSTVPDWGLPWPRPAAPTDGLAIADPRLWNAKERMGAIREDLDRKGAPSFGVVKPEATGSGSAWLKRLNDSGSL